LISTAIPQKYPWIWSLALRNGLRDTGPSLNSYERVSRLTKAWLSSSHLNPHRAQCVRALHRAQCRHGCVLAGDKHTCLMILQFLLLLRRHLEKRHQCLMPEYSPISRRKAAVSLLVVSHSITAASHRNFCLSPILSLFLVLCIVHWEFALAAGRCSRLAHFLRFCILRSRH
jgi:hypothetical protein